MKTPSETFTTHNLNLFNFENYRLEQIELERQKNKKNLLIISGLVATAITISVLYQLIVVGCVALVLGLITYLVLSIQIKGVYKLEFKNTILRKMVQSMDESFDFVPENRIELNFFKQSNFIKSQTRCKGEDFFTGKLLGNEFKGLEIVVETGSGKNNHVVFKGMFFVVDYSLTGSARVEILPDSMEKAFGSFGNTLQSMNAMRDKLVKFDNVPFEKLFVVYSNEEEVSRNVVSDKLMNCLLELREKFDAPTYLTFNEGKMFFGVHNSHDIFKVNINQSLLDNSLIKTYHDEYYRYVDALTRLLSALN